MPFLHLSIDWMLNKMCRETKSCDKKKTKIEAQSTTCKPKQTNPELRSDKPDSFKTFYTRSILNINWNYLIILKGCIWKVCIWPII